MASTPLSTTPSTSHPAYSTPRRPPPPPPSFSSPPPLHPPRRRRRRRNIYRPCPPPSLVLRRVSGLPTKLNPLPKLHLLWPTPQLTSLASNDSSFVINSKLESLRDLRPGLAAADVVVFFSPASSQLGSVREICDAFHPKPAVLFNPGCRYGEEGEMAGSFMRSFEVVYSFMVLEVRGLLSRKRGVVFRCAKHGGLGVGEGWEAIVEGEGGKMELVTSFKRRPTMGEVENVLYNVMAMNSPVNKAVKFLRNQFQEETNHG